MLENTTQCPCHAERGDIRGTTKCTHFEIIGKDPEKLGKDPEKLWSYYGDLFGWKLDWKFDTNAPVLEAIISQPGNYGFVDPNTTSNEVGILGGA